jgi:hypothetical protein
MPVRKYRSVSDMPSALFRTARDPANIRLACDLSAAAIRMGARRFPPGVYRHRSLEDSQRLREKWERPKTGD